MSKLISAGKCAIDLLRGHRSLLWENSAQVPCLSVHQCACASGPHGQAEAGVELWIQFHLSNQIPGHIINQQQHPALSQLCAAQAYNTAISLVHLTCIGIWIAIDLCVNFIADKQSQLSVIKWFKLVNHVTVVLTKTAKQESAKPVAYLEDWN